MTQDIRHAIRLLHRNKSFTSAVVLTHGLGVAVTCAVITVVYAMWRPLPYPESDRLVHLKETMPGRAGSGSSSYPDFLEIRRTSRSFDHVAGYSGGSRTLTLPGVPAERVTMAEVTDGFFEALGVEMAAGRRFTVADGRRGSPPVVILSDGAWRRRFGADRAIVGRTIVMNGAPHTIVGVLPASFEFPLRALAEFWLPVRPSPAQEQRQYFHWLDVFARAKPGVGERQLRDDLDAVAARFKEVDARDHPNPRLDATPLHDEIVSPMRSPMLVLTGAVVLVMLVTCANVAGLLLARATGREREMSVRMALGATHARLARQLLVESLSLGVPGALIGLAAGQLAARWFVMSLPAAQRAMLPRVQQVSLEPGVALITVGMALAAAALFGLAPAWRMKRCAIAAAIAGSGRTSPGRREGLARASLVSAQIALAVVLLASAGLLGKSVYRLLQVSPGFDATNLLTLRLNLPDNRGGSPEQILRFQNDLLERVRALPGVAGAETINQLPLTGRGNTATFAIDGRPDPSTDASRVVATRVVSRGYFRTMGIPLLAGRAFAESDRAPASRVVLVNRTLAEQVFGGAPLHHRISFAFFAGQPQWEIVGVVGDEQFVALDRAPMPAVYFAAAQAPSSEFSLVVRATPDPGALTASIRSAAATLDPALPVFGVRTMERVMADSAAVFMRRTMLSLLGVFAAAALILAAIGVYGVLAQSVAARTREIGVRMALGAERSDVVELMLARGLAPAAAGLLAGVPATLAATRLLRSLLYEVSATDAWTMAAVVALMIVVATAACLVPTWRALRIDPAAAIRQE